jgi:hypothetical protein
VHDPAYEHVDAIAAAVRNYLEMFPNARDTTRGIQEWWLPPALRDRPFAEVEQALWRLVGEGHVVASPLSNGAALFAKAPQAPPRDPR